MSQILTEWLKTFCAFLSSAAVLIFRVGSSKYAAGGAILFDVRRHYTTEEEEAWGRRKLLIHGVGATNNQHNYLSIISK